MLFNLDFANNPILWYFFFIITDLYYSVAEFVIPLGIPTKEAKAEIETHPVNVEITISKWTI